MAVWIPHQQVLFTRISASDYDTLGLAKLDCARFCWSAEKSIWIYIKEAQVGWEHLHNVELHNFLFSRVILRLI